MSEHLKSTPQVRLCLLTREVVSQQGRTVSDLLRSSAVAGDLCPSATTLLAGVSSSRPSDHLSSFFLSPFFDSLYLPSPFHCACCPGSTSAVLYPYPVSPADHLLQSAMAIWPLFIIMCLSIAVIFASALVYYVWRDPDLFADDFLGRNDSSPFSGLPHQKMQLQHLDQLEKDLDGPAGTRSSQQQHQPRFSSPVAMQPSRHGSPAYRRRTRFLVSKCPSAQTSPSVLVPHPPVAPPSSPMLPGAYPRGDDPATDSEELCKADFPPSSDPAEAASPLKDDVPPASTPSGSYRLDAGLRQPMNAAKLLPASMRSGANFFSPVAPGKGAHGPAPSFTPDSKIKPSGVVDIDMVGEARGNDAIQAVDTISSLFLRDSQPCGSSHSRRQPTSPAPEAVSRTPGRSFTVRTAFEQQVSPYSQVFQAARFYARAQADLFCSSANSPGGGDICCKPYSWRDAVRVSLPL